MGSASTGTPKKSDSSTVFSPAWRNVSAARPRNRQLRSPPHHDGVARQIRMFLAFSRTAQRNRQLHRQPFARQRQLTIDSRRAPHHRTERGIKHRPSIEHYRKETAPHRTPRGAANQHSGNTAASKDSEN